MNLSANTMKRLLNLYPPYLGAGIRVKQISSDWSEAVVSLKVRWYNRNAVGTHFGGSIYSMIDPHLMLMLMNRLGKDYRVWDQAAEIDYIKATRKPLTARISLSQQQIDEIRRQTANGEKYLPEFEVLLYDSDQTLIARVKKTLYVRKALKPSA
ncbi:DUF4442 domain-containing protein [Neptuniibacter halophilus]|uniref:DUF4442 domain-containing protein n=1 Tax=Neptuniibacter halophilus TaxID=651666 RepID=UPI0025727701|nr:DUF4442 domain-containing protein [Neptuniibacter halophilus]